MNSVNTANEQPEGGEEGGRSNWPLIKAQLWAMRLQRLYVR